MLTTTRNMPLIRFFSSLRLTVTLLAMSMALVFFGTLDQVHTGIYQTQKEYFEGFIAIWQYPEQWVYSNVLGWIHLPIPGGYLIGPLLLLNLIAAHLRYYKKKWRKVGIILIHLGVVLLLVGQWITQLKQKEYFLWLDEGETARYIESFHDDEFVIIDKSAAQTDKVVSLPSSLLKKGTEIQPETLPFTIKVIDFFPNAIIQPRSQAPANTPAMRFNRGIGAERDYVVFPQAMTFEPNTRNSTTAIVTLQAANETIGTWLVSNIFRGKWPIAITDYPPQTFQYNGKTFEIALRYKRKYLPEPIQLLDFTHDRYPGTDIPKNFASQVRILNQNQSESGREVKIYMNHPMRYAGLTFYQASFGKNDTASMFQVVKNPGRLIPYISCLLITLGLVIQFGIGLFRFAPKKTA